MVYITIIYGDYTLWDIGPLIAQDSRGPAGPPRALHGPSAGLRGLLRGPAGPRVFRRAKVFTSAFYRLYFLAFCLASVSSKSFPVFFCQSNIYFQIYSGINWHCRTRAFYLAYLLAYYLAYVSIWHNFWQFKATMLSGISFGILSGIRDYCVFSHSLWHSISPRRLWSRSGGHHSDPGFAVEVRRGEEDKKEERSGWHRISQPGTCRWRKDTNKAKEAHGSTIQAAQSLSAMAFYSIKGHGHAVWSSKASKNEGT